MLISLTAEHQTQRERESFDDEMAKEWDLESSCNVIIYLGDFNVHVGKCAMGFESVHGVNGIGKATAKKEIAGVL